jgi:hypothetical protein
VGEQWAVQIEGIVHGDDGELQPGLQDFKHSSTYSLVHRQFTT